MMLGNAAAVQVRLIVWCLDCRHQVEPDPAEMAELYGAEYAGPGLALAACVLAARAAKVDTVARDEAAVAKRVRWRSTSHGTWNVPLPPFTTTSQRYW